MILMHLDVGREVRVKTGLICRIKSEDEVALEVARIIEMSSRGEDKMELHPDHMSEIGLVDN
jgi:hypothetical protein